MGEKRQQAGKGPERKTRVAVVGTGLAGLTTAYLLQNDKQRRYEVTLFEQAETLSLDTASVTLRNESTGITERVDIPLRSYCRGYYPQLCRMYEHLQVPSREVWYRFIFSESPAAAKSKSQSASPFPTTVPDKEDAAIGSYFAYGKKWRALLRSLRDSPRHVLQAAFLFLCHMWFLAACYLVPSRPGKHEAVLPDDSSDAGKAGKLDDGESLREYLHRIKMPSKYVSHYLLPILCSVSSCSHKEMASFPASDVIGFMKGTAFRKTYVARNGVHQVQSILVRNVRDVRLRTRATKVACLDDGSVLVESVREGGSSQSPAEETFDRVVLAVPPNVAAKLFDRCRPLFGHLPTGPVITSILGPAGHGLSIIETNKEQLSLDDSAPIRNDAQFMAFRTVFSDDDAETESLHYLPSGAISRISCHNSPTTDKEAMRTSQFTRTLRTPASRRIVEAVFGASSAQEKLADKTTDDEDLWGNGKDNVWVVGSWCWDGMVLLEGCVVSAMRVAGDMGVQIPWTAA